MTIQLDQQGSNKIQLLEYAPAAPNKCASCGWSATEYGRYYIDMQVDLEFYGVVYLCTYCFAEVAKILGLVDPGKAAEEQAILKAENDALKQIVEDLNAIVPDLDVAIRAIRRFSDRATSNLVEDNEVVLDSAIKSERSHPKSNSAKRTAAELLTSSRSASVLDSTDDEQPANIEL